VSFHASCRLFLLLTNFSHNSLSLPGRLSCAASKAILALEGVVDHGLFLDMVDVCIIAGKEGVEVSAHNQYAGEGGRVTIPA
jgi:hypothetical protein